MAEPNQTTNFRDSFLKLDKGIALTLDELERASAIGDRERELLLNEELAAYDAASKKLKIEYGREREKALKELATGEYKKREAPTTIYVGGAPMRTGAEKPKVDNIALMRQRLALVHGADPDAIDLESGLPGDVRRNLSFQPALQDKVKFLQQEYGSQNVNVVNIDGTDTFFVRQGNKIKQVDERGASLRDLADLGGDIFPTITGAAAGYASKGMMMPVIGAAGTAVGGGLQDIAFRELIGSQPQEEEVVARRGGEAVLQAATDYAFLGLGRMFAKRFGKGVANKFAEEADKAVEIITAAGFPIEPMAIVAGGEKQLLKGQSIAGKYGNSAIANLMQRNRDVLGRFKEAVLGKPSREGAMQDVAKSLADDYDYIVAKGLEADEKIGRTIAGQFDRKLQSKVVPEQDKEPIGKFLLDNLKDAEKAQEKIKSNAYNALWDAADQSGVQIKNSQLLGEIEAITKDPKLRFFNDSRVDSIVSELRQGAEAEANSAALRQGMASGKIPKTQENLSLLAQYENDAAPISLRQLDNLRKRIKEAVPQGGMIGTGRTNVAIVGKVQGVIDNLEKQNLAAIGLKDAYDSANSMFRENMLQFNRTSPGAILAERFGGSTLSPTQIVDNVLSDPRNVRDAITALSLDNPQVAAQARAQLGNAYLSKIGLNSSELAPTGELKFNPEIVKELFGFTQNGRYSPAIADNMVKDLRELGRLAKLKNININDVTFDDVFQLGSALTENGRRRVMGNIVAKAAAEKKARELANNTLIKLAIAGDARAVSNTEFSNALFKADIADINEVLKKLSPADRTLVRKDAVANLFRQYPSDGQVTSNGMELWNSEKFLRDYNSNKGLRERMNRIFGNQFTEEFVAASRNLYNNRTPMMAESMSGATRSVMKPTDPLGSSVYLAVDPKKAIYSRFLGFAYGNGTLQPFLRLMAKNVGPEKTAENMNKIVYNAILGKNAVQGLTESFRDDPSAMADLLDMLNGISQEDTKLREQFQLNQGQ